MDSSSISVPAQQAMDDLAVEVARIEAEMEGMTIPVKGAYLSHMASKQTFAVEVTHRTIEENYSRLITSAAVSLLTASLVVA